MTDPHDPTLYYCSDCLTVYALLYTAEKETKMECHSAVCGGRKRKMTRIDGGGEDGV